MILQWLRESNNNNEDKEHINADNECKAAIADHLRLEKNWLIEYVATESIWTIDLVMLLQHIISDGINSSNEEEEHSSTTNHEQYSFSYLFCSTKFGVTKHTVVLDITRMHSLLMRYELIIYLTLQRNKSCHYLKHLI